MCIARIASRDLYVNGFCLMYSLGFFVLLIGSSSLGVRGCTCVRLLVGCSVLGWSVACG